MICLKCQERKFTIRGLCDKCDPQAHADHAIAGDFMREAAKAYESQTGRDSLADWHNFEAFLERFIVGKPSVLAAFERELEARGIHA